MPGAVRYRYKGNQSGCRNADAGGVGLEAYAQLCNLITVQISKSRRPGHSPTAKLGRTPYWTNSLAFHLFVHAKYSKLYTHNYLAQALDSSKKYSANGYKHFQEV
jgi:hypothetical protein